ncbi:MAG: hypothetical protein ACT4P7_03890, partial [Gemmatimonadaceae bacterium]
MIRGIALAGMAASLAFSTSVRAQAPAPWIGFSPQDPSSVQSASVNLVIDVCDQESVILPENAAVSWNGAAVAVAYPGGLNCGGDNPLRMTKTVTAIVGDNELKVDIEDELGWTTEYAHYFFGAWITPRDNAAGTIRANGTSGAPASFEFLVQNTAGTPQTYDFALNCLDAAIQPCGFAGGGQSLTLTFNAGQTRIVGVTATTAAPGLTGALILKARKQGTSILADSTGVFLTTVAKTIEVLAPSVSRTVFLNTAKTQAWAVRNNSSSGPPITLGYTFRCAASTSCGPPVSPSNPMTLDPLETDSIRMQFVTGNPDPADTLHLAVFDVNATANRDSGTVIVATSAPTVTVTAPATVTPPSNAFTNVTFTLGDTQGTTLHNWTRTCTNVACVGPSSGQVSPGTTTSPFVVEYTAGNVGAANGSIGLVLTQVGEAMNTATAGVTVAPTISVAFAPPSKSVNKQQNTPTNEAFVLTNAAQGSQTFTVSVVLPCTNMTSCSVTNPVTAWAGNNGSVTANFTPASVGQTGTMTLRAEQQGNVANAIQATITVTPTSTPILTLVALSPPGAAKNEYANATDTLKYVATWSGASPLSVTYAPPACSGILSACQTPTKTSVPASSVPDTVVVVHQVGNAGSTGPAQLTVNQQGGGASANTTITVTSARPRVTVKPAPPSTSDPDSTIFLPTTNKQFVFSVTNDTSYAATYNLFVTDDAVNVLTGCTGPTQVGPIGANQTQNVTVTCANANTGLNGWVELEAREKDKPGNKDSGRWNATVGAYLVVVQPKGTAVSVPAGAGQTQIFTVDNTGTLPATFEFSTGAGLCTTHVTCTSVFPASQLITPSEPPVSVTVTYNSGVAGNTGGQAKLHANVLGRPITFDQGSVTVTATAAAGNIVADLSINNFDNYRTDLCEASCFAVRSAVSTVPYIAQGEPRGVTLLYNSDAVAARPIIHADVRIAALQSGALQEYWLEARDSIGGVITFVNGDTKLRFTPPLPAAQTTTSVRLSGQFDATQYSTGVHEISLLVSAKYATPTPTETKTIATKILVVNERKSPVAKGWSIAGLSRLQVVNTTNALIVDGSGSAVYFVGCGLHCFTSPGGEFSRLTSAVIGGLLKYIRTFPDSSQAHYRTDGRLERTINRELTDTVTFDYDGQGRLTQVSDPIRKYNSGFNRMYTELTYNTQGITSVKDPGPRTSQSVGSRVTVFAVSSSDSTLTQVTEPGGLGIVTKFLYDASKRLQRVIDPRPDTTRFVYNATTWKVDSVISPLFKKFPSGTNDTTRLRTRLKPWQTVSLPLTTTTSTMFTPARADTIRAAITEPGGQVTAFTVDRWGQPLVTTDPLGRLTTIARQSLTGLPLSVTSFTGAVDQFTYDAASGLPLTVHPAGQTLTTIAYGTFNQVTSITASSQPTRSFVLGPRGRVDQAKIIGSTTYTTQYGYDPRQRVNSVTDPGGHTTFYTYDGDFGNVKTSNAPGSRLVTTHFDAFGRDSAFVHTILPTRTFLYDSLNRVKTDSLAASLSDPVAVTRYGYSDKVNLTSVDDPANNLYTFVYNALGDLTQQTDPFGGTEKSHYDFQGRLIAWVSRLPDDSVRTTYDVLHRPTQILAVRGMTAMRTNTFTYDPNGLWVVGANGVSRDSIVMDASGWTTQVATRFTSAPNSPIIRTYLKDAAGRLDSVHVTYPGSIVATGRKYVWNTTTGALTAARVNGNGPAITFGGTELVPTAVTYPGGVTATMGTLSIHNQFRQKYTPTTLDPSFWRLLNYDQVGRVDVQHSLAAGNTAVRNFKYDTRGRLKAVFDSTAQTGNPPCETLTDLDYGGVLCGNPVVNFNGLDSVSYSPIGNPKYLRQGWGAESVFYNSGFGSRMTKWPRGA